MVGISEQSWQTTEQKRLVRNMPFLFRYLRGTDRKRYAKRLF